jgi:hypothetical protein
MLRGRREVSMQQVIQSVLAAAILLGTAATTGAESVMKQCGEQWQAAKSAGTMNGATSVPELQRPLLRPLPLSLKLAPVSMAALLPRSGRTNGHGEPERHEAVWRAVASRKGSWDNTWTS